MSDVRLALWVTQKQLDYLDQIIKERGETKSVWIRQILDDAHERKFLLKQPSSSKGK